MIISLIFGLGSVIFSFYLRTKDQDYKYLPILYLSIGFIFTVSSLVWILRLEPIIGVIIFFGGMISILISSIIFRKQIRKENVDRMVKKLKRIDSEEKIKVLDFFMGKFAYKLMLKKGVKYTAKTRAVVLAIGVSLPLILFFRFSGHYNFCFLTVYFIIYFSLLSIFGYHFSKNIYEDAYNEYHEKYSDDDLFSDSSDFK